MYSGTCDMILDGADAFQVEYKYNDSGRGHLWMAPDVLMEAFSAKSVILCLQVGDLEIIITSATPGEAAPFAFKEWRKPA